ncbi:thioredoxin-like protein [Backusella circina FSU 941]|nr:thioredoxin-like protein [Backusella circina FSU 941]
MSSNKLPFTIQDDIQARENYAAQKRVASCTSRKIRWWTIIILTILATFGLLSLSKQPIYSHFNTEADQVQSPIQSPMPSENELPLIEEIANMIKQHTLIVFSKTYCPYSMKAKTLLNSYQLKEQLIVVEVDLRDDAYEVKQVLGELSGRNTFPNIFLNKESIGGSDLLEGLHSTGQLRLMLEEHGLLVSEKAIK